MNITREQLLDLLTTAAIIGRNELDTATTRGDITEAVESRMRKHLAPADNDVELVRAIVAGWDHDTVYALANMVDVGIAATLVMDQFAPDPDTRALVQRARNTVQTLYKANTMRHFLENGE